MRKILFVLCLLTFVGIGKAQNCNLEFSGNVVDYHDGSFIVGATVYIKELKKYVVTDIDGHFEFNKLCEGNYTVNFSHLSCEDKDISIVLNSNLNQVIYLEHHIESLEQVNVVGKTPKVTSSGQETNLSSKVIEQYSSFSLGDALKEVSGISTLNTGQVISKPIINGLHSSRIIIMTNNVRLQDQEWGIEHSPNIDLNASGSVSVIKGSAALEFGGDAVGGIVNLKPKRYNRTDSLYGKTIISGHTNGQGFTLHSALTKTYKSGWFASINGTHKNFGDFESPDYNLSNTGYQSSALSLETGYKSFEKGFDVAYTYVDNEIGILRASHIGNIGDLVSAINSQEPSVIDDFTRDINSPKQDVKHHLVKINAFKRLKSIGKLSLQYDYQNNRRLEYDVRIGDNRNRPALDLELQTHTISAKLHKDNNLDRIYAIGLMGRYQTNFANPDTGVRRLIPDYDKYDFGIFLTTEWNLDDYITLDTGIRYDFNRIDAKKFYRTSRWIERGYNEDFPDLVIEDLGTQLLTNPVFDYHNLSASLGLSILTSNNNQWLANASIAMRPPNPSELFSDGLHHSAARIELGDLRIEQETSYRLAGSYLIDKERLSVQTELFYNFINNYILIEPSGTEQTLRGAFPVWEYRQTNANLFGLDIDFSYQLTESISFENKSSFIKGYETNNNEPLIDIPAVRTSNSIEYYNQNWYNFTTGLTSEYVFAQNEFPNNNFEQFLALENTTVLVDVSTPPDAYHLLNWFAQFDFKLKKSFDLNLNFSITNLLNTNYRDYLDRLRYFADDLGRNYMLQITIKY